MPAQWVLTSSLSNSFLAMFVQPADQLADLLPYQSRWDALARDCVFRSWLWLSTWWKHYQSLGRLEVLLVFSNESTKSNCAELSHCQPHCQPHWGPPENLVAILPLYVESTRTQGRALRFMGDGEVCSEHLDLICEPKNLTKVADALTDYLISHNQDWDVLSFANVARDERNISALIDALAAAECEIAQKPGVNCWSIALPSTWEEFLAMQSKSHRKQIRQMKSRVLDGAQARWFLVDDLEQFDVAWECLIDLHQRRRESLGEPGCFASPVWANFHREVARELLAGERLRLSVLELEHEPIAAEYHLASCTATYAYQGGIDPDRCGQEPGQLSMILCIERAIAEGHDRFELLRGDEPYKAHWRAKPTPTVSVDVISPRAVARWRHYTWSGLRQAGRLVRQLTNLLG